MFADLAKRLCIDCTNIPLLFPVSDKADHKILERLPDLMIDIWFQKHELNPANYQMWTAKSELTSKYKELNASSPAKNEAKVNQEISRDITKSFKRNLRNQTRRMS